jgi:hypothetical protein
MVSVLRKNCTIKGKLVLVSDSHFAIDETADGEQEVGATIESQLRHVSNPYYTVDKQTRAYWLSLEIEWRVEITEAETEELPKSQTGNKSTTNEIRQAAWGKEEHVAPPGAAFEFL